MSLVRFAETEDGTLGRLGPWAVLEEEDQGNAPNISSIPPGSYRCVRSFFHRGGYETFEVLDVPDRSGIKFHIGNTEEDTAGCPLLGMSFGALNVRDEDTGDYRPKLAVIRSREAFQAFMEALEGHDEFGLHVRRWP